MYFYVSGAASLHLSPAYYEKHLSVGFFVSFIFRGDVFSTSVCCDGLSLKGF